MNPSPRLPFWEKRLGDEGYLAKLGCTPIARVLLKKISSASAIAILFLETKRSSLSVNFVSCPESIRVNTHRDSTLKSHRKFLKHHNHEYVVYRLSTIQVSTIQASQTSLIHGWRCLPLLHRSTASERRHLSGRHRCRREIEQCAGDQHPSRWNYPVCHQR